jgi:hypothetical protein
MADTTTKDPLDVSAQPIPLPQTGALKAPGEDEAAESLATAPDMGATIAQHQIAAGQVNHGDARDWAENAVAGVQAALAGFGAAGKVPPGAGALYGVGAAARAGQENRQQQAQVKANQVARQRQQDLEERKVSDIETNENRDYQLRLAENARQQAQSVRAQSEHDARLQQLSDEHTAANMRLMHEDITFRQNQIDHEETLKTLGAKPMQIAGQETPAFDDLGQLEQYAVQNKLGQQAHLNGYRERPVLGADNKYHIYQVPDSGPEWHTVKDADGKPTKVFGDPLAILNFQEKVAQTRESGARASLDYAKAKRDLEDFKDQGTVKAARKALDKVGGDYSKLEEGQKEALRGDAMKQEQYAWNVLQAARRDMEKDSAMFDVPPKAGTNNPDTNSPEYKELAKKYHVEEADAEYWDAYDTLRKLGHGYNQPGTGRPTGGGSLPRPPQPGAVLGQAEAKAYLDANGGDPAKARAAAQAAGWGIPGAAAQTSPEANPRGEPNVPIS